MKQLLFFILIPLCLSAGGVGLKTLIEHAQKHHGDILAKELLVQAKEKEKESQQSSYWPTLDIGASYAHVTPSTIVSPKETASAFLSLGIDLYDGGRKSALIDAKNSAVESMKYEKSALQKHVTLGIIEHFYTVKKLKAMLHALYTQSKELKAQLTRIRKFTKEGLATAEEEERLEAVYENNRYNIEQTKLMLEYSRENLSLLSGLPVHSLREERLVEPKHIVFEPYEKSRMLNTSAKGVEYSAQALEAGYKPQIRLEETYSRSHFSKSGALPGFDTAAFLPDHQNKLSLTVHMRLFDHGRIDKESEALRYQKLALLSEYDQSLREQKMQYRLAKRKLQTLRSKRKSAKSALKAAQSSYQNSIKKFEAGLVDDIAYLDALNRKTLAEARYKETLYEYEIAKSILYFYAGKDPKEFVR